MLLFSDEDLRARAVKMNVNLVVTQGVTMGVGGVLYMALLLIFFFKKEGIFSRLYGFLAVLDNFLIFNLVMKLCEGTTWSADGPLICAIFIFVLLLLNYIITIISCFKKEIFNSNLLSALTSLILTTILILGVTCEYKQ